MNNTYIKMIKILGLAMVAVAGFYSADAMKEDEEAKKGFQDVKVFFDNDLQWNHKKIQSMSDEKKDKYEKVIIGITKQLFYKLTAQKIYKPAQNTSSQVIIQKIKDNHGFQYIEIIDLNDCYEVITDWIIETIANRHNHWILKSINLFHCRKITRQFVEGLFCKNLKNCGFNIILPRCDKRQWNLEGCRHQTCLGGCLWE